MKRFTSFMGILIALVLLALTPEFAEACGGNGSTGFTISQTGSCGGGSCGAPSSAAPQPSDTIPEFAMLRTTTTHGRTMQTMQPKTRGTYTSEAIVLPQASDTAVLTSTDGENTLQMPSTIRAGVVPYVDTAIREDESVTTYRPQPTKLRLTFRQ